MRLYGIKTKTKTNIRHKMLSLHALRPVWDELEPCNITASLLNPSWPSETLSPIPKPILLMPSSIQIDAHVDLDPTRSTSLATQHDSILRHLPETRFVVDAEPLSMRAGTKIASAQRFINTVSNKATNIKLDVEIDTDGLQSENRGRNDDVSRIQGVARPDGRVSLCRPTGVAFHVPTETVLVVAGGHTQLLAMRPGSTSLEPWAYAPDLPNGTFALIASSLDGAVVVSARDSPRILLWRGLSKSLASRSPRRNSFPAAQVEVENPSGIEPVSEIEAGSASGSECGGWIDVAVDAAGLAHPATGIAFGMDGTLYAADAYGARVLRFDGFSGRFDGIVTSMQKEPRIGRPWSLCVTMDDELLVLPCNTAQVAVLNPSRGELLHCIPIAPIASSLQGRVMLHRHVTIARGPRGVFAVADHAEWKIRFYQSDGTLLGFIHTRAPHSITFDSTALYVVESDKERLSIW